MTDHIQVRIKGIVATQRYGTLESGDILRTDAAFAKHLVEDCRAAEYCTDAAPAEKLVKGRKKKPAAPEVTAEAPAPIVPAEPAAPADQPAE